MRIEFHREFEKQYKKLRSNQKKKFQERHDLFLEDSFHPLLNNHALRGRYAGYRSINVGGDLRAIFKASDNDTVLFADIGPHGRLYG